MPTSEEGIILAVCWLWGVSELVGMYVIPRLRGKGEVRYRADKGSRLVIWVSLFFAIAIINFFAVIGITLLPDWFFPLGIGLMLLGIVFRQWSIFVLGKYFSTSVRLLSDHKIVTTGPYRYIRHPAYTGSLLILLGLGLASRTWGGTLIILAMFGIAFGYRIIIEEKMLTEQFGQDYGEYGKRTKRLIPFLF